jgi:acetyl-CoA acyltransferase
MRAPERLVVVAGGEVGPFGRWTDRNLVGLTQPVVAAALIDAGIGAGDVQAAYVGNGFGGLIQGQETILGQLLLAPCQIEGIPIHNLKNACSSGSDAFSMAWSAVAYGQYDCVLVVGAEKMTHEERGRAIAALASASDRVPTSAHRSVFMDLNSERALKYMEAYGANVRHFAQCAVKNRQHAQLNPNAAEHGELTVDQVIADREVLAPLTRSMCGGICDGAAAVILVSEDYARRHGLKGPEVAASVTLGGRPSRRADEPNVVARAGRQAYEMAGVSPGDISLAEVHDPTAPQELLDVEDLALTGRGEAYRWLDRGDLALGGRLPVNVSGGLVSRGHPVGATGVAQIVEISRQLMGRSGAAQVANARLGLAQMSGGLLGTDSAVATVHILKN